MSVHGESHHSWDGGDWLLLFLLVLLVALVVTGCVNGTPIGPDDTPCWEIHTSWIYPDATHMTLVTDSITPCHR